LASAKHSSQKQQRDKKAAAVWTTAGRPQGEGHEWPESQKGSSRLDGWKLPAE